MHVRLCVQRLVGVTTSTMPPEVADASEMQGEDAPPAEDYEWQCIVARFCVSLAGFESICSSSS